jgi:hypothetical protein
MAEINIERKERRLWPWLLGIALLVLLFMLMRNRDDDTVAGDTRADTTITNTSTGDVSRDTVGGTRRP